jgi:predicted nucleic acid-binding protein
VSRYLLDTDVLIDYSKGREPATSFLRRRIDRGDELGLCAITVAEFFAGVPPDRRAHWRTVLSTLTSWDISPDAALRAGAWRHDFRRRGIVLSTADTVTAAVAVEHDATLLTRNTRDYPMEGLALLPLAQEAGPS